MEERGSEVKYLGIALNEKCGSAISQVSIHTRRSPNANSMSEKREGKASY
jgi:hypothetical protein